jgi:hypothetical protein
MVLVAITFLALQLCRTERIGFMTGLTGHVSAFRALRVATAATLAAGAVPGGVVVTGATVAGDLDVSRMIESHRIKQVRKAIELDLGGSLPRGSKTTHRAQQSAQEHPD